MNLARNVTMCARWRPMLACLRRHMCVHPAGQAAERVLPLRQERRLRLALQRSAPCTSSDSVVGVLWAWGVVLCVWAWVLDKNHTAAPASSLRTWRFSATGSPAHPPGSNAIAGHHRHPLPLPHTPRPIGPRMYTAASIIGTRLHWLVSLSCLTMATYILFLK